MDLWCQQGINVQTLVKETALGQGLAAVQSLVQSGTTKVPIRFVRPLDERPCSKEVLEQDEIPIIDGSRLEDATELEKLHEACANWGFIQLRAHGIPTSLLKSTRGIIKDFFNLPQTEKESYAGVSGKEGYGRYFVPSKDTVLDWGDVFFHTIPPSVIQWPQPAGKPFKLTQLKEKS